MLTLYGTAGCHLCEEAQDLLEALSLPAHHVDVAGDEDLLERYGVRIPVIRRTDGAELGWPFTAADLLSFAPPRV
ncbi:MAG: glutaredoxin family protein [Methylococcaceae bacterium]|nr:MAG: glutaredoxin family protein [Methylococcaceae bacterium]